MIIHLGYPKCASTSLQQLLAASDANFLGCNTQKEAGAFYDEKIGNFFECALRIGSDQQFEKEAGAIRDFLAAQDQDKTVLSYENISLRLTPWDVPTDIKLKRLANVLPGSASIILCVRELQGLLISLYKNHLSCGYTGHFENFLEELILTQEFGILCDFDITNFVRLIREKLNPKEIIVVDLDQKQGFEALFEHLKLSYTSEERFFESIKDDQIETIRAFNANRPNKKQFLDWLELHRIYDRSTMDEANLFALSRLRKEQENILENSQATPFIRDQITWPEDIIALQNKNAEFLKNDPDVIHL